ncbi:MAG: pyruvate dehydrogenase E2 component (dihydrolipoamide acetyltransferase) [Polyangiales bacterium]|jgi:pyruvate dehydrogenase E2 component (dihydrolipoamide acetyltransferase)
MANYEFRLPDIGEGVAEGEIVEWLVNEGDIVAEDDPMVEVMTDKATVTIGAPSSGTITDVRFGVGQTAQVGDIIVVIVGEGAAAAPVAAPVEAPAPEASKATTTGSKPADSSDGPAATAVGDIREGLPGTSYFKDGANSAANTPAKKAAAPAAAPTPAAAPAAAPSKAHFSEKPLATPATRKLARDLGHDLRTIPPSGPGGRTTRDDVKSFGGAPAATASASAVSAPSVAPTTVAARQAPSVGHEGPLEERKPFVGIRRKIAQRMQNTVNTAAHFTFVEECDVTELIALRQRLRPAAAEAGIKLSFLPFIVKAVVASLKKHPVLNTALDETTNELVYRKYYDIGIAAATPNGLMVPVLQGADRLSILDVAREIDRLGEGARAGTLGSNDLSGSTFTITSLGKQGGLFATPILNHPEVGILGVHQMKRKPVVRGDEIVIGDVMLLSLSFDHRIVDGHVGAAFAYEIISYLENPDKLFLEMA